MHYEILMKPTKSRKLNLRTETIRPLTTDDLKKVNGGLGSVRAGMCSTWDPAGDQGCFPSANAYCASDQAACAPSVRGCF